MSTASLGWLVGSWEIAEPIGRGGQATVHRARHTVLGRPAAVKLVHPEVWEDRAFRVRFQRECDALAAIDHPHVIPVLDAGEVAQRGFLAMRLAGKGTLADELREGALAPDRALDLLEAIASALDAVHGAGRVHRDVTPANILLDDDGGPWLGDFGLARRIDATIATQEGMLVGTAAYLAPEVIAGGRAGPEADRYALAAVAYHALTGHPPFVAPDLAGVLYGHLHLHAPPVAVSSPQLPGALDEVFALGLSRRPGERPPSGGALLRSLREALEAPRAGASGSMPASGRRVPGASGTSAGAPTAVLVSPRRGRGRTFAGIALALSALMLGIGGGFAYTQRDALPLPSAGEVEPPRTTSVPGVRGLEVAAVAGGGAELPGSAAAPDAVVASVGDLRVVSMSGGAASLVPVRAALETEGFGVTTAEFGGRPIGLRAVMPWSFFSARQAYGLMVVREPAGDRALVVKGSADAVDRYMDGLADAIGARILPTA